MGAPRLGGAASGAGQLRVVVLNMCNSLPLAQALIDRAPRLDAALARGPPNILFIVADDLGYNDLGAYNGGKTVTPHLDSLVKEGAPNKTQKKAVERCRL